MTHSCNKEATIAQRPGNVMIYMTLLIFLLLLALLSYAVYYDKYYVDFSSLYMAMKAVWENDNPYRVLYTEYLPVHKKLPANLNPPFTLLLFSPFYFLPYHLGLMLYFFGAIFIGLVGAAICGHYFLERTFWKRYSWLLLLFYTSLFSTLAGISIAQLGAPLFFLLMLGYHFYRQNKGIASAVCFALAIALKLFPGVLLFFFLQQKRYRIFFLTCGFILLFLTLPFFFFRFDLYELYFSMMHRVMWYGDSWNASFYGILMRYFVDTRYTNIDLWPYQLIWLSVVLPSLFLYTKSQRFAREEQRSFAMALVLMILLSPFGWLYYLSLLMPAFALLFHESERRGLCAMLLWFLALVLTNFPMDYVVDAIMGATFYKLTFYSLYSYGVLLLTYLMIRRPNVKVQTQYGREVLFWPVVCNQLFGLMVFINIVITRF